MKKGRYGTYGAVWALTMLLSDAAGALEVEGRLDWMHRVELGALVSGVVAEVGVAPGERVAEGALLLRLDQRALKAAVIEAEARVVYLTRVDREAQREQERARELYDRTLLSDHERELAEIGFERARAELRQAEANLVRAHQQLEYSRVESPFAGIVLALEAVPGQSVNTRFQSLPLVTVAGTERMKVRLWLDDAQLRQVQPGDQISLRVGEARFQGVVEQIGLDPGEGMRYPVDIAFNSGKALLRAGQRAIVELP